MPRLPRPTAEGSTPEAPPLSSLRLCEADIQTTARFTREFVVMSLIPWMEQRVMEWNENVGAQSLMWTPHTDGLPSVRLCQTLALSPFLLYAAPFRIRIRVTSTCDPTTSCRLIIRLIYTSSRIHLRRTFVERSRRSRPAATTASAC